HHPALHSFPTRRSSDLAQKVGANIIGAKEGQSAGGKVSVSLAKVDSLAVGETRRDDVDVGIVDLSQIAKTIGTKIDGDLGYNFRSEEHTSELQSLAYLV